MPTPPKPIAEGNVDKTPLVHVMLSIEKRALTGTLAVWPESERNGQDRVLFDRGQIVAARLLDPASSLERGLLALFHRRHAPYAFYEADLIGKASGIQRDRIAPLRLVVAAVRGGVPKDALDRVLGSLGTDPVRVARGIDEDAYGFLDSEKAFIDFMRAAPAPVDELLARSGNERVARRLLYILRLTGAVETFLPEAHERRSSLVDQSRSGGTPDVMSGARRRRRISRPLARTVATPVAAVGGDSRASSISAPGARQPSDATRRRHSSVVPLEAPDPPPELEGPMRDRWVAMVTEVRQFDKKNYLEMLGVSADATAAEIRRQYLVAAKTWHPDSLPRELEGLEPWAEQIFRYLTQARDVLTRGGYLKALESGGGTPEAERKLEAIVSAALEYEKVGALIRQKRWMEALHILDTNLELNPEEADYHATKAWVLMLRDGLKSRDNRMLVATLANEALRLNDNNERAHLVRAAVHKEEGQHDDAIAHYQRVVEINPRNVQAMRELRLSQMRDQKEKKKPLITLSGESTFLSKLFKKDE